MATNKTLLMNLGFNDPDKKLKTHDLGVTFLSQNHIIEKIVPLYFKGNDILSMFEYSWIDKISGTYNKYKYTKFPGYKIIKIDIHTEYPVSKGEKQYKTTIGFLDGIITINISYIDKTFKCLNNDHKRNNYLAIEEKGSCPCDLDNKECVWAGIEIIQSTDLVIYVEIKITPQTSGDIIRQINLYREHMSSKNIKFLLAYNFDLSETEIKTIEAENILCVKLGSQFETWCKEKLSEKSTENQNRLEF